MVDTTAESDSTNSQVQFSELGLGIGTPLTLETVSPVRKLVVRLIGFVKGRSILVTAPMREGKEVYLEKHSALAVRLMEGRQVCAFETQVLYRSIQPYSYYHLAYPEDIEALQIRNAERIETLIDAHIDSDFDIIGDWPRAAKITNLSRTGACLQTTESPGLFGHEIMLEFDIPVSGMNIRVSLAGIIRNIEEHQDENGIVTFVTGLQFLEMSDEARLSLANYIHEHHAGYV